MSERKSFDIHNPWKLKNDSRLPKTNQVNYLMCHCKQSGNITQCFIVGYIDTLSCQLFRPKKLASSPVFSFSHTQSFLSTPPSTYIQNISPLSPGPYHLSPRSQQFLPTDHPISIPGPLGRVSFQKVKLDQVTSMLKPPSGFSALARTERALCHLVPVTCLISSPATHPHSPHSRHSDFLVVSQTHLHTPAPRPGPLLFPAAETLFT